jgi:AcrR family transcriptional regulator
MTTDGRVARRWRNQNTVLDAVIALFDAGQVEPTVDEVSELSGVSTRSIYRYFRHREGLIDAAVWRLVDRVEADLALHVGDGPLDARIAVFVGHRLSVFARIASLVRASKRLARTLPGQQRQGDQSDGQQNDAPRNDEGLDDRRVGGHDGQRLLFAIAPSVAFADDFGRVDPASRKIAEISADVMFQFDTLDGLAQTLASEPTMMAMVLERHLRQQIVPL